MFHNKHTSISGAASFSRTPNFAEATVIGSKAVRRPTAATAMVAHQGKPVYPWIVSSTKVRPEGIRWVHCKTHSLVVHPTFPVSLPKVACKTQSLDTGAEKAQRSPEWLRGHLLQCLGMRQELDYILLTQVSVAGVWGTVFAVGQSVHHLLYLGNLMIVSWSNGVEQSKHHLFWLCFWQNGAWVQRPTTFWIYSVATRVMVNEHYWEFPCPPTQGFEFTAVVKTFGLTSLQHWCAPSTLVVLIDVHVPCKVISFLQWSSPSPNDWDRSALVVIENLLKRGEVGESFGGLATARLRVSEKVNISETEAMSDPFGEDQNPFADVEDYNPFVGNSRVVVNETPQTSAPFSPTVRNSTNTILFSHNQTSKTALQTILLSLQYDSKTVTKTVHRHTLTWRKITRTSLMTSHKVSTCFRLLTQQLHLLQEGLCQSKQNQRTQTATTACGR